MSFKGKVILITGASGGIGAACAEYFAKEGALLALVGRNPDKFKKVLEKIKQNGSDSEPLIILADISIDSTRIMDETIEKYGRLDILINNAGFTIPGSIETTKIEHFDGNTYTDTLVYIIFISFISLNRFSLNKIAIFNTNVRGTLLITQRAVPHLITSKGNIVNVSSVCGMRSVEGMLGYCMSKSALDQFTKCTALDLIGKGVRVNSVNPGKNYT